MFLMALTAVRAYFFIKKSSLIKYLKLKNIRFFEFGIVDNSKKENFLS